MIEINELSCIKAVGYFLAFYESDLHYIQRFQAFKNGEDKDYLSLGDYSFNKFINEFRIARNISKETREEILLLINKWCKRKSCDNVNGLASEIKKHEHSHGNLAVSFASKILFLNNPYEIFPLDQNGKDSLGLETNDYQAYLAAINKFKKVNKAEIKQAFTEVNDMAALIENEFIGIKHLKKIRENRLIDKILWVHGNK